ncbi:hypothetical protein [Oceanobacillus rekensis]|uniref:hypothetical protein n=1 Tax=Oceanobacillus rekensis TaxID=937927 RepID=UPI000B4527B2|nr:hypothetical protein [Oceanobacillus rekensis]
MKNKKELNLNIEAHSRLVTNIIEKSLAGVTVKEITELRQACELNRYEYYNKLKLKYIVLLGLLGLDYKITQEIEESIFFLMHDIIQQISTSGNPDIELYIKIS